MCGGVEGLAVTPRRYTWWLALSRLQSRLTRFGLAGSGVPKSHHRGDLPARSPNYFRGIQLHKFFPAALSPASFVSSTSRMRDPASLDVTCTESSAPTHNHSSYTMCPLECRMPNPAALLR